MYTNVTSDSGQGSGVNAAPAMSSCAGRSTGYDSFAYEVRVRAADIAGDGSQVDIVPSPTDNTDRSSLALRITSSPTEGLDVIAFTHTAEHTSEVVGTWEVRTQITIAEKLDMADWHLLACNLTVGSSADVWVCAVDGIAAPSFKGYFTHARTIGGWDYVNSCRVRFQPKMWPSKLLR